MALSGVLVSAGYAGSLSERYNSMALAGRIVWSEKLTTPGASAKTAPAISDAEGSPVFYVNSAVDVLVAIGQNPNTETGPVHFVKGGCEKPIYVQPGDKLAWAAA